MGKWSSPNQDKTLEKKRSTNQGYFDNFQARLQDIGNEMTARIVDCLVRGLSSALPKHYLRPLVERQPRETYLGDLEPCSVSAELYGVLQPLRLQLHSVMEQLTSARALVLWRVVASEVDSTLSTTVLDHPLVGSLSSPGAAQLSLDLSTLPALLSPSAAVLLSEGEPGGVPAW
eukprot:RCo044217